MHCYMVLSNIMEFLLFQARFHNKVCLLLLNTVDIITPLIISKEGIVFVAPSWFL